MGEVRCELTCFSLSSLPLSRHSRAMSSPGISTLNDYRHSVVKSASSGGYSNEAIFSSFGHFLGLLSTQSTTRESYSSSVNDNVIRRRVMMLAIAL